MKETSRLIVSRKPARERERRKGKEPFLTVFIILYARRRGGGGGGRLPSLTATVTDVQWRLFTAVCRKYSLNVRMSKEASDVWLVACQFICECGQETHRYKNQGMSRDWIQISARVGAGGGSSQVLTGLKRLSVQLAPNAKNTTKRCSIRKQP